MLRSFRNDLVIAQQNKHPHENCVHLTGGCVISGWARRGGLPGCPAVAAPAPGLPLSPSPDSPVGCSRWYSVNVDLGFNTEDRLVLGLTLGRHLGSYTGGARRWC